MSTSSKSPSPSTPPDPVEVSPRPEESQTLVLPDNRTLGFSIYGSTSSSSPTIFLFHGMPGSRLVGRSFTTTSTRLGLRLITLDRPGYGSSTFAPRSIVDWPADVLALADHLQIRKFSIIGASAGGPFALSCARFMPAERLRRTMVVCGIGPLDALLDTTPLLSWRLCGVTKWVVGLLAKWIILPALIRPYLKNLTPAKMKALLTSQASTPDEVAQLANTPRDADGHVDNAVAQMLEAFRQGPKGAYLDGGILTSDWGFKVENIDGSKVRMVHGDRDQIASIAVARWIDWKLGGGRLRVVEGGTHGSIWEGETESILRSAVEGLDSD
ncbi:Alpha/Beta hydrolase protein [Paraphoma chrysanthemicola]|uniref:Alpha/Beta hydrolase protein n=1 Tax=Paraphoma chrysanthemicola TaxID=798071 RepID=A0A8K0R0G1_9PLEO|nr:Alpha/Beta hydrolase protein [Paraphoma chrysanthemicola]